MCMLSAPAVFSAILTSLSLAPLPLLPRLVFQLRLSRVCTILFCECWVLGRYRVSFPSHLVFVASLPLCTSQLSFVPCYCTMFSISATYSVHCTITPSFLDCAPCLVRLLYAPIPLYAYLFPSLCFLVFPFRTETVAHLSFPPDSGFHDPSTTPPPPRSLRSSPARALNGACLSFQLMGPGCSPSTFLSPLPSFPVPYHDLASRQGLRASSCATRRQRRRAGVPRCWQPRSPPPPPTPTPTPVPWSRLPCALAPRRMCSRPAQKKRKNPTGGRWGEEGREKERRRSEAFET